MKKTILLVLCAAMSLLAAAQNTRMVQGVVFNEADVPMEGVTLSSVGLPASCVTGENGTFQLYVSPYAKKVEASMEGYISQTAEIDGSYLVFKLKVDREYVRRKALAEAAARQAAEQEAAAKAKAEEEARLATERATTTMAYAEQKEYNAWSAEESAQPSINSPKRHYRFAYAGVFVPFRSFAGFNGYSLSYTEGVFNQSGNLFLGQGLDYRSYTIDEWDTKKYIGVYVNGKYFLSIDSVSQRVRPFVSLSLGAGCLQQHSFADFEYLETRLELYAKAEIGLLVNIQNNLGVYASCDWDTQGLDKYFSFNLGVAF